MSPLAVRQQLLVQMAQFPELVIYICHNLVNLVQLSMHEQLFFYSRGIILQEMKSVMNINSTKIASTKTSNAI